MKTATEWYGVDEDLKLLISAWVRDYRAPIGLADRLRELGLESQAVAAEWAANVVDRIPYYQVRSNTEQWKFGLYPGYQPAERDKTWYWHGIGEEADCIPPALFRLMRQKELVLGQDKYFPTVESALLFFLDLWAEAVESGIELDQNWLVECPK